jgi:hypothetical protein
MNNYAYATLLSSDDYLLGVLGLYYSLKYHQCEYPLVVMVTDHCDVSPRTIELLHSLNIKYHIFKDLRNYYMDDFAQNKLEFNHGQHSVDLFQVNMMNKVYLWDLKEYDKVCYFDADILVGANIDFVFDYPTPAAKPLCLHYHEGKEVFNYAGENIIISPQTHTSEEILKLMPDGAGDFDENILSYVYGPWEITHIRITDELKFIFHAHANMCKFRYWDDIPHYPELSDAKNLEIYINMIMSKENPFMDLGLQKEAYERECAPQE